jgi:5'-methylthioadenosine phosphorylase/5'-methylthioinosine phosphorylase
MEYHFSDGEGSEQAMSGLAVIGGSGFASMPELEILESVPASTAYGEPSAPLIRGRIEDSELWFLARHGGGHTIPPHRVNYRANIRALADAGVDSIVALGAVGGIAADCGPLAVCIPDQLIDYTHGRDASFFDGGDGGVVHVDFTSPFSPSLRRLLVETAGAVGVAIRDGGVYGVTQGPRLETAAEVRRMERDGCDLVGMTAMPEAVLARELGISYATLAFVVNWAAGKTAGEIGMAEINANIAHCADSIRRVLVGLAARLAPA